MGKQSQHGQPVPSSPALYPMAVMSMGRWPELQRAWLGKGIIGNLESEVGSPLYGDFLIQADA